MSRWFRHYAGMCRDDKLVRAALQSKQPVERVVWIWCAILESAAEIDDGGRYEIDHAEMGRFLRTDPGKLVSIEDALHSLGRLSAGSVAKWGDRQFKSDRSADRQRRYRERQETGDDRHLPQTKNVTVTSPSRQRDAPETETETKAEPPLTPPRGKGALDEIERECREAAGVTDSPHPGFLDLSPILTLIDRGHDLSRDILPVLKAKREAGKRARSWAWFLPAITDRFEANAKIPASVEKRVEAPPDRQVFVVKGTPEWEAWQAVKRTSSFESDEHGAEGWWFPSLVPSEGARA